ncbi:MAG: hypothetical protein ACRD3Q_00375, partial [Terriglobales bacterium]
RAKDKAKDKAKDASGKENFESDAKDGVTRDQMNAAIRVASDAAEGAAVKRVEALYAARKAVEPVVGVVAFDSADQVYEFALKHLKIDIAGVHPSAYPTLLSIARKASAPPARVAMDAAAVEHSAVTVFPGLKRIRNG